MAKKIFRPYSQLQPSDIALISDILSNLQNFNSQFPYYNFRSRPVFQLQIRIAIERIVFVKKYLASRNNHVFLSDLTAIANDCLSIASQLTVRDFNEVKGFYSSFRLQYDKLRLIIDELISPH